MSLQNGIVANHTLDTGPLLTNAHLQTIWANTVKSYSSVKSSSERVELPDGDFVDLEWSPPGELGVVLLLHGLEGGADSSYIKAIFSQLTKSNFQAVLLQFRGCSGVPNRLTRTYHSGHTSDLDYVAQLIVKRLGKLSAVIGYSLGGNVLLKWLGESNKSGLADRALAVSVPFDLAKSATRLDQGFSRIYRNRLIRSLQNKYILKAGKNELPCTIEEIRRLKSFWSFDEKLTAPIHGFSSAEDYYTQSSCQYYLNKVSIPTLIIQSKDDPFLSEDALPKESDLSPHVHLILTDKGGHVAFLEKNGTKSYLTSNIMKFISQAL